MLKNDVEMADAYYKKVQEELARLEAERKRREEAIAAANGGAPR